MPPPIIDYLHTKKLYGILFDDDNDSMQLSAEEAREWVHAYEAAQAEADAMQAEVGAPRAGAPAVAAGAGGGGDEAEDGGVLPAVCVNVSVCAIGGARPVSLELSVER